MLEEHFSTCLVQVEAGRKDTAINFSKPVKPKGFVTPRIATEVPVFPKPVAAVLPAGASVVHAPDVAMAVPQARVDDGQLAGVESDPTVLPSVQNISKKFRELYIKTCLNLKLLKSQQLKRSRPK